MRDSAARASGSGDVNARIAERVRELRTHLGLSLDALAGRSGVSRSMLSLIERGESSPTAVLLEKVATGLNVPLAALFDDASAAPVPLAKGSDRASWQDPETGYIRRNVSPPNWPSPFQIVDVMLPAGARVAYETARREIPIHQQIWMREGRIEVTVGHVVHQLSEDDCLAMELIEPITFRNRTRRPATYVVVVAAEYGASNRR